MSSVGSSRNQSPPSSQSTAPTQAPDSDAAPDEFALESEEDSGHFEKWRPSYHLMAPTGWMNDPCAPGYDPQTGLYHISYQWNMNGPDWGNIAWGSATSPDMISWIRGQKPTLSPDAPYDRKGVFTGCFINERDGSLAYAYTSVSVLPIHHTIPHQRGCETLSLARSFDSGKTWVKSDANPILPGEPQGLDVAGWRDPYVAAWPKMAQFLGLEPGNTLFGIISGGLRGITPTVFLYAIHADNTSKWSYVGPLFDFGLNLRPSRWSGDLGKNWEVVNFVTLKDEEDPSVSRDLFIMGTEGCIVNSARLLPSEPSRPSRGQLWMSGSLRESKGDETFGPVTMSYDFGGHLDHGCLYAANSFHDPRSQRQILWGWVTEDDLCDGLRHRQGWSGMLSMPRELRLQTLRNVVGASASDLASITSIELEEDDHGSHTVRTLASQPLQRLVEALRRRSSACRARLERSALGSGVVELAFTSDDVQSTRWELDCSFILSERCGNVGIRIDHSKDPDDLFKATTLNFNPTSDTFTISRPSFTTRDSSTLINRSPEYAPHTLFTTRDPKTGAKQTEPLHVRAWRDNSVLEVFVNGRTAITTRLYAADKTFRMRFFADDTAPLGDQSKEHVFASTELLRATLWDRIGAP